MNRTLVEASCIVSVVSEAASRRKALCMNSTKPEHRIRLIQKIKEDHPQLVPVVARMILLTDSSEKGIEATLAGRSILAPM